MKSRAEIEALAERIVLATMDRDQIWDRAAFEAAHPEAAMDRRWIAERYRELNRTLYPTEAGNQAIREWIAGVLIGTFGVEVALVEVALTVLRAALTAAPDDASRLDLLRQVSEDYCLHCGKHIPDDVCYCTRDE